LARRIGELSLALVEGRLSQGLFPQLEETCRRIESQTRRLHELEDLTQSLRRQLAAPGGLGARLPRVAGSVSAAAGSR
jgi:hypothetical protein